MRVDRRVMFLRRMALPAVDLRDRLVDKRLRPGEILGRPRCRLLGDPIVDETSSRGFDARKLAPRHMGGEPSFLLGRQRDRAHGGITTISASRGKQVPANRSDEARSIYCRVHISAPTFLPL